jgi:hypothetical protein
MSSDGALPRTRWEFRREDIFYEDRPYGKLFRSNYNFALHTLNYDWAFSCIARFVVGGRDTLGGSPDDPWDDDVPLVGAALKLEWSIEELNEKPISEYTPREEGGGPRFVLCRFDDDVQVWGPNFDGDPYGIAGTATNRPSSYTQWDSFDVLFATVPLSELDEASRGFSRDVRAYLLPAFPSLRDNAELGEWFRRDD